MAPKTLSLEQKIESKKAVIVGRSKVVGLPVALMLLNANATVTSIRRTLIYMCAINSHVQFQFATLEPLI